MIAGLRVGTPFRISEKYLIMNESATVKHRFERDEITLVDLTRIALKRKRLFFVVFLAVALIGVSLALLLPPKYGYVSFYRLPLASPGRYVHSPEHTIALLGVQIIPRVESLHRVQTGERLPFNISVDHPADSGLIALRSDARSDMQELVNEVHSEILQALDTVYKQSVEELQSSLETKLERIDVIIERLSENTGRESAAALAGAYQNRLEAEASLTTIRAGSIEGLASHNDEPLQPTPAVIIALSIFMALVSGLSAVFLREFWALVRAADDLP